MSPVPTRVGQLNSIMFMSSVSRICKQDKLHRSQNRHKLDRAKDPVIVSLRDILRNKNQLTSTFEARIVRNITTKLGKLFKQCSLTHHLLILYIIHLSNSIPRFEQWFCLHGHLSLTPAV
jgi:hypothetical protein